MDETKTPSLNRRGFLTKSALAAGAAAGAGSLLHPGDGERAEAANSRDITNLTVMYGVGEISKPEIKEFERLNPSIKVKQLEYNAVRLAAMTAAGAPPDFVRTQGAPEMPNVIARGLATNLDHYFATSQVLKPESLLPINDVYRWDGKAEGQGPRYGAVKDWSQDNMFWINKRVFDRAGVKYPSETEPISYDELLTIAKKLTVRKSGKIQVYGLDVAWGAWMQGRFMQMLAEKGLSLWNADYTEANFTSPEMLKVLKWHVDWAQAHVGPSPLEAEPQWGGNLFLADRLGIMMYGYWYQGYITNVGTNKAPVKPYQLCPSPQWGSKRISGCYAGVGAYIPSGAKNKEAAWKFMEYFAAQKPAFDRATSGWGIPGGKQFLPKMPQATSFQRDVYKTEQHELPYVQILHFGPYVSNNAMENAIQTYMLPVMKGQQTLNEGARTLQNAVSKLIRLGKQQVGA